MGIPPTEVSYLCDRRLTWWPVCDRNAVTGQRNARTQLSVRQDFGHEFPIAKEPPRTNTLTVPRRLEGVCDGSILRQLVED